MTTTPNFDAMRAAIDRFEAEIIEASKAPQACEEALARAQQSIANLNGTIDGLLKELAEAKAQREAVPLIFRSVAGLDVALGFLPPDVAAEIRRRMPRE